MVYLIARTALFDNHVGTHACVSCDSSPFASNEGVLNAGVALSDVARSLEAA